MFCVLYIWVNLPIFDVDLIICILACTARRIVHANVAKDVAGIIADVVAADDDVLDVAEHASDHVINIGHTHDADIAVTALCPEISED